MKSFAGKLMMLLLVLWWAYLFFTTQMVVVFDSEGYESVGRMIHLHGWQEFLRKGPQREPMFPGLIAWAMSLGEAWGVSYYYPLKLMGVSFLALTLAFSYRLMRMLAIGRPIAGLAVFYLGISPVMTNSSMRLWSEFAAYPWVVLAVIWTIKSWKLLANVTDDRRGIFKIVGHALMVAVMFLLIMSVKAVAEGVILFYLWPFYGVLISHWRSGHWAKARQVLVFCLIVLATFEGTVNIYRLANEHYNGHFTFTTRGDWALYGNTARRIGPLSPKLWGAAVAFVPGMGICPSIFGDDNCDYWSARHSDDITNQKTDELKAKGVGGQAASRYFVSSSLTMILSNPLQEILLMLIEAQKMFFWESSIAFVAYPDWLERIFYSWGWMNALKIAFAFLSWAGCTFAFCYLCYRRWKPNLMNKEQEETLLWVFNFIFWYTAMYSLYFILDRYAFPLIALYMVLIAFLLQKITKVFHR